MEVFDDWYAAGPEADDYWQKYEQDRGHSFLQALDGYPALHVSSYDRYHLDRCGVGVLLLPAGRSGHLELGYMIGQGKPGYILMQGEPERFDVMYCLATRVFTKEADLMEALGCQTSR
jgi:nucleoside 2-deoxyribosyltransferase